MGLWGVGRHTHTETQTGGERAALKQRKRETSAGRLTERKKGKGKMGQEKRGVTEKTKDRRWTGDEGTWGCE